MNNDNVLKLVESILFEGPNPNWGRFTPQEEPDDFKAPELTNNETQHLFAYIAKARSANKDDYRSLYNQLMAEWKNNNFKTKKNEIIKVLDKAGITSNEVRTALQKSGAGPSFIDRWFTSNYQAKHNLLDKLADEIIKNELGQELLQIIDKRLNSGITKWKAKLPGMGKVHENRNVFKETVLTDKDVRSILINVLHKKKQSKNTTSDQTQQLNQYIKLWSEKISKSKKREQKIALVKEIVNFLADRYKTSDWKNINGTVLQIIKATPMDPSLKQASINHIKNGQLMEKESYFISTLLLIECDLSWNDLGVKPLKINETHIRLDVFLSGKNVLLEDVFEEVIIKNKLELYEHKSHN